MVIPRREGGGEIRPREGSASESGVRTEVPNRGESVPHSGALTTRLELCSPVHVACGLWACGPKEGPTCEDGLYLWKHM